MASECGRSLVALTVALAALVLAGATLVSRSDRQPEVAPAPICDPAAGDLLALAGERVDPGTFAVELASGEAVSVRILQLGADVVLRTFAPDGSLRLEMDRPTAGTSEERATLIATEAGRYCLEVAGSFAGSYQVLSVSKRAPAAPEDTPAAAAEIAYAAGIRAAGLARWEEAMQQQRAAADLFAQAGEPAWQGAALIGLGQAQYNLESWKDAREALSQGLALLPLPGEASLAADTHNTLGFLASLERDLDEAGRHHEAAARLGGQAPNEAAIIESLRGEAEIERLLGDFEEALAKLRGELDGWRRLGRRDEEAAALVRASEVLYHLGDGKAAEALASQAFTALGNREKDRNWARAHLARGRALVLQRQFVEARREIDAALELYQAPRSTSSLAAVYQELGQIQTLENAHQDAVATFQRAEEIYLENDLPGDALVSAMHRAWALERGGSPEAALEAYPALHEQSRRLGLREVEASINYGLARAHLATGELELALQEIERAILWVERRRQELRSGDAGSSYLARKHDYYRVQTEILMRLNELEPRRGRDREALLASEQGRARALFDLLFASSNGPRSTRSHELDRQLAALKREIHKLEVQLDPHRPWAGDRPRKQLGHQLETLLAEAEQVERRLLASDSRYASLVLPPRLNLDHFQREILDEGTRVLVFSLGEPRSWLFVLDQTGLRHFELPDESRVIASTQQAYGMLSNVDQRSVRDQLPMALEQLSNLLFGETPEILDARRLVIVPDGLLHYLSFAALPVPGSSTREPLIATREIVQSPSLAVLAQLRRVGEQRPPPEGTLALLGDPVVDLGDLRFNGSLPPGRAEGVMPHELADMASTLGIEAFKRLPSAAEEANEILSLVPPDKRWQALGFAATPESFQQLSGRRFRFLHLSGHGVISESRPSLSGLVLSQYDERGGRIPGILRLSDIFNVELPVETVVLSACSTGLGKEIRGEGLVGLTRGFFHAGAQRVVISLWDVSDMATTELMKKFYRAMLVEGLPATAALHVAQNEMRAEPQWRAPFYWAGFVVQGDWR